jgi:hypothetical protein
VKCPLSEVALPRFAPALTGDEIQGGVVIRGLGIDLVDVASIQAQIESIEGYLDLIYALRNGPGESGSAVDHLVTPETLG